MTVPSLKIEGGRKKRGVCSRAGRKRLGVSDGETSNQVLGDTGVVLITMIFTITITGVNACRCENASVPMGSGKTKVVAVIEMKI